MLMVLKIVYFFLCSSFINSICRHSSFNETLNQVKIAEIFRLSLASNVSGWKDMSEKSLRNKNIKVKKIKVLCLIVEE